MRTNCPIFELWDRRQSAAIVVSIVIHVALLLILIGERAAPLVEPPRPVEVSVIDDPRGLAAGIPTDDPRARAPSSGSDSATADASTVRARPKSPEKRLARTQTAAVIAEPVTRPTIDEPRFETSPSNAAGSADSQEVSAEATNAGSGQGGKDASGSFRRIAFVTAAKPSLDFRSAREAKQKNAYAIVAVRIDTEGRAHDLRFLRASGNISLDNAIRVAVVRSRYQPHLENGKPVEFWAIIPYVFGDAQPDISGALASAGFEHT